MGPEQRRYCEFVGIGGRVVMVKWLGYGLDEAAVEYVRQWRFTRLQKWLRGEIGTVD